MTRGLPRRDPPFWIARRLFMNRRVEPLDPSYRVVPPSARQSRRRIVLMPRSTGLLRTRKEPMIIARRAPRSAHHDVALHVAGPARRTAWSFPAVPPLGTNRGSRCAHSRCRGHALSTAQMCRDWRPSRSSRPTTPRLGIARQLGAKVRSLHGHPFRTSCCGPCVLWLARKACGMSGSQQPWPMPNG